MADFDLEYDVMDGGASEGSAGSQAFNSDDDDESSVSSNSSDSETDSEEEVDEENMLGLDDEAKEKMALAAQEKEAIKSLKLEILHLKCQKIIDCMSYSSFHEVAACVAVLSLMRKGLIAIPSVKPGQNLHTAVIEYLAQNPEVIRSHLVESFAENRTIKVFAMDFINKKGRKVIIDGVERMGAVTPNESSLLRSFMS